MSFVCCIFAGIEIGILAAIGFTLLIAMYYLARPRIAVLGYLDSAQGYVCADQHPSAVMPEDGLVLHIEGPILFPAATYIQETIQLASTAKYRRKKSAAHAAAADEPGIFEVRYVVIDMCAVSRMDATAAHALAETADKRALPVHFARCNASVEGILLRAGTLDALSAAATARTGLPQTALLHSSVELAMGAARNEVNAWSEQSRVSPLHVILPGNPDSRTQSTGADVNGGHAHVSRQDEGPVAKPDDNDQTPLLHETADYGSVNKTNES